MGHDSIQENLVERMQIDTKIFMRSCLGKAELERAGGDLRGYGQAMQSLIYNTYTVFSAAPCRVSRPVPHSFAAHRLKRFPFRLVASCPVSSCQQAESLSIF